MSNAYRWKGDQMFYLLVKVSFAYLFQVDLNRCAFLFYLQKHNFFQRYSDLSDFHSMAKDFYVTWLDEFSVILFYLLKVTSLEEIGLKLEFRPLHKFRFPILKWFVCAMTD